MDEPSQTSEISFSDAVSSLVSELPAPIQEFLKSPERDEIAIRLAQKYALHVDQAGVFQLAYLHMLIGVISPEEFSETLKTAGIPGNTVSKLINDVNEEVFKPLREKERQGNVDAQKAVLASTPPVQISPEPMPAPTSPTPIPVTSPVPVAPPLGARPQPLTPFNLPVSNAPANDIFRSYTRSVPETSSPPASPRVPKVPAPIPVPVPVATITPPVPAVAASIPVQTAPQTARVHPPQPEHVSLGGTLRTMATDMQAVNEHREPEPVLYKGTVYTPPVLIQEPAKPIEKPPLNRIQPPAGHSPTLPTPLPNSTHVTPTAPHELIKEYATDPYRESM